MCVCKQWQSLLSTQDFRQKNHYYHIINQKLVILDAPAGTFTTYDCGTTPTDGSGTTRPLPFGPTRAGFIILGSYDGLVCLAIMSPFKLMLWNPLTGAYKLLKSHSCCNIHRDAFGFYVDFSNDYKLLRVVRSLDCYTLMAPHEPYIYSRRLDSWRKIESFNYPHLLCRDYQWSPGTFCGRNLYFTVVSRERSCVIGFDVELETFREIKFPEEVLGGEGFNGSLVVMNGCVHLCVPCHNIDREFYVPSVDIDLWRMDCGGDGWMKVAGYSGNKTIPVSLTPNCVVRSGKWDVTWVFHKALTKVNVMARGKLEKVFMYDAYTFYDLVRTICVETLVSPNP